MKIDRLLGIVTTLLQKETITAPELAKRFEVSRRTISRDIEDLCKAGIPIVTVQGYGGGIRIAEGFTFDKNVFTAKEMEAILIGLQSLDSVSDRNQYGQLYDKLTGGKKFIQNVYDASGHIVIDLASYYKGSLSPKLAILKEAIERQKVVMFDYFGPSGESHRKVAPYLIVFQWGNWYLWGRCLKKEAFRLFKLNRLQNLIVTETLYIKEQQPPLPEKIEEVFPNDFLLVADIKPTAKWRLIEEYGVDCYEETEEGMLRFSFGFASKEHALDWILSFGDQAKIIEPAWLQKEYVILLKRMRNLYEEETPHV